MYQPIPEGRGRVVMKAQLDAPLGTGKKRGQSRRKLRLATTAVQGDGEATVDILNISLNGLLVRTSGKLTLDEPVMVVLPTQDEHPAHIVWFADDLYGCRFLTPLTQAELSAVMLRSSPDGLTETTETETPPLPQETFGQRLKRLRVASPHSMIELANLVGVTKPTLWKWETDKVRPRDAAVRSLAAVLGVDEMTLLYGRRPVAKEASSIAVDSPAKPAGRKRLSDIISDSKDAIAELAGVEREKVLVSIDWD